MSVETSVLWQVSSGLPGRVIVVVYTLEVVVLPTEVDQKVVGVQVDLDEVVFVEVVLLVVLLEVVFVFSPYPGGESAGNATATPLRARAKVRSWTGEYIVTNE